MQHTIPTARRHALAVAACELIPIPLVDTLAQNEVRRSFVRRVAKTRGQTLSADEVSALADQPLDTASRVVRGLLKWPVKKLLGPVYWAYLAWSLRRSATDTLALVEALDAP
jgi:hypothetical protein